MVLCLDACLCVPRPCPMPCRSTPLDAMLDGCLDAASMPCSTLLAWLLDAPRRSPGLWHLTPQRTAGESCAAPSLAMSKGVVAERASQPTHRDELGSLTSGDTQQESGGCDFTAVSVRRAVRADGVLPLTIDTSLPGSTGIPETLQLWLGIAWRQGRAWPPGACDTVVTDYGVRSSQRKT